jgi:isocitrate dehydrogenase (NAD+)
MKLSDGLFLDCCRKVGREYPEIHYEEFIIDNLCMQLVKDPTRFDVMVLENLYGDIVSDLCAGLVGGLGVVPGANIGERTAVFEAVHGTAPDIAGKGIANPTALMMSAVMMLDWLGMRDESKRMQNAIEKVYTEGKVRTGDLGGTANTREFTEAIIAAL